jgi:hypothetical protein
VLQTHTSSDRVSVAEDALAAFTLTVLAARQSRHEKRATRAVRRAERRADRAVRLVMRGRLSASETPGSQVVVAPN